MRYVHKDEVTSTLDQAIRYHQNKDFKKAGMLYTQILKHDKFNVNALHLLGLVELELKNNDRAENYVKCAIKLEPKQIVFHINLGIIFQQQKKYAKAEVLYNEVLQLQLADDFDLYFNLGLVLAKQGKLREAKTAYEKAIKLEPNNVKAYNNLAGVLLALTEVENAIKLYNKALNIDPRAYKAANNLGNIYFNYYGNIEKATAFYQKAVVINHEFWEAKFNLANCYRLTNQIQRSVITYQACLKQGTNNVLSWYYLGVTYQTLRQIENAINAYEEAIKLMPKFLPAISNLYYAKRSICDWQGIEKLENLLAEVSNKHLLDKTANSVGEEPFINIYRTEDGQENKQVAEAWSNSLAYKMRGIYKKYDFSKHKVKGKIKVGYIADNFNETEVAYLTSGLFKTHDRVKFEVFVYAYGKGNKNNCALEMRNNVDHFIDLSDMDYAACANRIYADGIHILVDLKGHTRDSKFEIMALKPAPIQLSYLSFPGTTGAKFVDYTLVDDVVFQEEEISDYTENLIMLPNCYHVTDRWQEMPLTNIDKRQFGFKEDQFVFAVLNNSEQIDLEFFSLWMKVLSKVPNSVLILHIEHEKAGFNLRKYARSCGIEENRIQFVTKLSKEQLLASLKLVDLVLDTRLTVNGVNTLDALWAGVPVVTLYGEHLATRITASMLNAIGLADCIAETLEEYEYYAVDIALDQTKLLALKQMLVANRLKQPLFDTALFCRNLEKAYQQIWMAYLAGNKPRLIEADAKVEEEELVL